MTKIDIIAGFLGAGKTTLIKKNDLGICPCFICLIISFIRSICQFNIFLI